MGYNFNAEIIAAYLAPYKDELENLYKWKVGGKAMDKLEEIISGEPHQQTDSAFGNELQIKKRVYKAFSEYSTDYSCDQSIALANWIIRDWGGIYTGETGTNKVLSQLRDGLPASFERISSKSKVLSFRDPENNIIYDSRVAYVLNWIILSRNAGDKYFPIPEGRNTRMMAFDLNVLIRLKNVELYKNNDDTFERSFITKRDAELFLKEDEAYKILVGLIRDVHSVLWKGSEGRKELYYTEMLLFSIADTKVYKDITENFTAILKTSTELVS
jgi:hypothetical protein